MLKLREILVIKSLFEFSHIEWMRIHKHHKALAHKVNHVQVHYIVDLLILKTVESSLSHLYMYWNAVFTWDTSGS